MKKTCVTLLGDNGSPHIQKWISAIQASGAIDLHVLSLRNGVQYNGVQYYKLKPYFGNKFDYLLNIFLVKKIIKKINPDVVHAHYATSYGLLGALTNYHPFIITGWGADIFDSPKNPFMKMLLKYSFRKADDLTVLTEVTRIEMLKLTPKQVHLIPFGVDLTKFVPNNSAIQQKQVLHIGTIRTLQEKYGVEFLIRGFANAEKLHPNIFLDIIGDGVLRESLETLALNLGIAEKVKFHGYVNQNEDFETYIKLLQEMDIFAILSILDSETFGVACVEASACKIPVIASDIGGLPEVVDNNETGILVEPKNVDEISKALIKLIEDSNLRKTLGEKGRLKVEKYYDWDNNTQQMIDLYTNWGKKRES